MEFAMDIIHLFINYEFEHAYGAEFTPVNLHWSASESSERDRWKETVSLITHSHLRQLKIGKAYFNQAQLVPSSLGTTAVLLGKQKSPHDRPGSNAASLQNTVYYYRSEVSTNRN